MPVSGSPAAAAREATACASAWLPDELRTTVQAAVAAGQVPVAVTCEEADGGTVTGAAGGGAACWTTTVLETVVTGGLTAAGDCVADWAGAARATVLVAELPPPIRMPASTPTPTNATTATDATKISGVEERGVLSPVKVVLRRNPLGLRAPQFPT